MNSKYTRIFLFVAVIVVWGLILYRIMTNFSDNNESEAIPSNNLPTTFTKQMPDTFSLLLNYDDPFLASTSPKRPNTQPSKPVRAIISTPKIEIEETPMPPVKYYGLITNKKTQKLVAIVNIGGKQYLAKQGDLLQNITLLKMTNDSILITYGHTKKWISK